MVPAKIKKHSSNTNRTVIKNGKIYDLQSPNKSFIRLARDLKFLGVKKWYFMLEVKDKSVLTIDPYQQDKEGKCTLSKDQVARVLEECRVNPWYFIREVVRLKGAGGGPVPYGANRGNIAQSWCLLNGIDSYLTIPRQQGKTMTAVVLIVWALLFGTNDSLFIFFANKSDKAKDNLSRVKDVIDLLPEYMRHEYIMEEGKTVKAVRNATTMKDPVTRNSIMITSSATSEESAMNIGRGFSAAILYFDEPEFTKFLPTIITNTYPAFAKTAAIAKENHSVYGRIFTSTPGDLGTKTGLDAMRVVDNTVKWTDKMYDWGAEKVIEYMQKQAELTPDGNNGILYIEYHYYQLGLTRKWADDLRSKMEMIDFRREVLLQRMNGSDAFPYSKEDLSIIESHKGRVVEELYLLDFFTFKIYRKLNPELPYLIGIDCSTGTNGDNNAITIINPIDLKVDSEFSCNYIGETQFEDLLKELCKTLPKAVLVIERNSVGDSVIDHLLNTKYARNLYYDKAKDLNTEKFRMYQSVESLLKKQAQIKKFYGVYTHSNREDMFAILAMRIKENREDFIGENLIKEIGSLIKKGTRIEAGPGAHDDSVMSYLIAMYVYYYGNNLPAFGITPRMASKEDLNNSGLNYSYAEVSNLDSMTTEVIKDMEEKEKNTSMIMNWEEELKANILASQKENQALIQRGYLKSSVNPSEEQQQASFIDDEPAFPMSFFDEMNGI